ncbi:helix-turn-helix domain-containing protein [Pseudomonas asiatica]|uniref:AlbA family DNA-binding domain-containing protein n=1 Tax=Pseudomonas asiatica TaxID=2219225 RepID=UPI0018AA42E1|nr:ATP-binding protein [Pseudomonas asiatica]MBF8789668.1 ATP-binding protein [Pseudomonas asiatica]
MIDLLNRLRYKSESTDIDFKSAQYRFNGGSEADKAELLKDILAIANSWRDGTGYILLGFKDQRPHPAAVVGIQDSIDDSRIQQFVNSKVKPKLTFRYEEHLFEEKTIGILIIPKQRRPFYLTSPYGKLKSNVVYVRRGSSTDEAEPIEAIEMAKEDDGRDEVSIELSLMTPQNEPLPPTLAHTYLQFIERLPDFKRQRQPRGPFDLPEVIGLDRDNTDFWREYGKYSEISNACIALRFVMTNRSGIQLSNAKLEVTVEAVDSQDYEMVAYRDLPEEPKPTWCIPEIVHVDRLWRKTEESLRIDESGAIPACHIRFGSLLPGEQGRSELLAIVPKGPGKLRLHMRVLGSELASPIESSHLLETTGDALPLDFEGFRKFLLAQQNESS